MEFSKLKDLIERILPIITKPPYDKVRISLYNYKGLYEINFIFELPEELYDIINKEGEQSNIEQVNARFEAYKLLRTINNYLNTRIVINNISFKKEK